MSATVKSPIVAINSYLTDGRSLFRVVDLVPGEAVLLENAIGGEFLWQALEDLMNPSLRPIVPSADAAAAL